MEISTALIQQLRNETGAGIVDCKNALVEKNGDLTAAQEWLRIKGISKACKKSGRSVGEGVIEVSAVGGFGVIVEINSETDFVARSNDFQNLVINTVEKAINNQITSLNALAEFPLEKGTISDYVLQVAGKVGENVLLRKFAAVSVCLGVVASYLHSPSGPSLGKIGVLLALQSEACVKSLEEIGKKIAMHVAAANPQYINRLQVSQEAIRREQAVLTEQAATSGKPQAVIEKMVEGRLEKFLEDIVLEEQDFILQPGTKIKDFLKAEAERLGSPIVITEMICFRLGKE